mmetsp:Transcript_9368/g.23866  ORF Transcript_9368/g.23866 Transcript_9368/m.23866 type:complete len:226 (+) Transcript_9368:107-784(+)
MYVGAPHSASGSLLRNHRRLAVAKLDEIKKNHPHLEIVSGGSPMSSTDYVEALRHAKMFVSPFGFGEFSGKDYESALAGCLLVKPMARKLAAYPNIYADSVALDVKADFSDLEGVVLAALRDLDGSQAKVDAQRQQLLSHDVQRLARDLDSLLRERLQQSEGAPVCEQGMAERVSLRSCARKEGKHAYSYFSRERTREFLGERCQGIVSEEVRSSVARRRGGPMR